MSTKETTTVKRTAGEWIVDEECIRSGRTAIAIMVDEGFGFASWDERAANARFIVRAVNAHDELVSACKIALGQLDGAQPKGGVHASSLRADIGIIRAAIAKAEGALMSPTEYLNKFGSLPYDQRPKMRDGGKRAASPPKSAPEGNPERLRASLKRTLIEVGTGEPGYRWVRAWIVVAPDGTEFYPPYQSRYEAKSFAWERGWLCP